MPTWTRIVPPLLLVPAGLPAAAIVFGGPSQPQPMGNITEPFRQADYGTLPPLQHIAARDGTPLAFRRHRPDGPARGSVVLADVGHAALTRQQQALQVVVAAALAEPAAH